MVFHLIAFVSGFILDLIFGDPVYPFHPVRLIGRLISAGEKLFTGIKTVGGQRDLKVFLL